MHTGLYTPREVYRAIYTRFNTQGDIPGYITREVYHLGKYTCYIAREVYPAIYPGRYTCYIPREVPGYTVSSRVHLLYSWCRLLRVPTTTLRREVGLGSKPLFDHG